MAQQQKTSIDYSTQTDSNVVDTCSSHDANGCSQFGYTLPQYATQVYRKLGDLPAVIDL